MRVATATCTVGTARATGRNTPGAGAGPTSAGLLPSTNSRIGPESWAGSARAISTEDSVLADWEAVSTAAALFTVGAASTAAVGTEAAATVESAGAPNKRELPFRSSRTGP